MIRFPREGLSAMSLDQRDAVECALEHFQLRIVGLGFRVRLRGDCYSRASILFGFQVYRNEWLAEPRLHPSWVHQAEPPRCRRGFGLPSHIVFDCIMKPPQPKHNDLYYQPYLETSCNHNFSAPYLSIFKPTAPDLKVLELWKRMLPEALSSKTSRPELLNPKLGSC